MMESEYVLEDSNFYSEEYTSPERLHEELGSVEEELDSLLEFQWSYVRGLLKFGLASWVFGLSMFVASLLMIHGPSLVLNAPPISISLLVGAVAAPFLITAVLLRRYKRKIKELKKEREDLKSRYEKAFLFERKREAEERKELLYTTLRQDLRSKCQLTSGYLQMLKDADISDDYAEYLDKASENTAGILELIEKINNLREVENGNGNGVVYLGKGIEKALERVESLAVERDIELVRDYRDGENKVVGGYHVESLISNLLEARLCNSGCDQIRISIEHEDGERVLVRIEDDGEKLDERAKEKIIGEKYNGETSGLGGLSVFISRRIAEKIDCKIQLEESELDGARFDVYLKKAT